LLEKFGYRGPLIMQAYRDEEGIQIFKKQFNWVKRYLGAN
jgi:L-ribulose-5-phosphate 3-epimerase